MPVNFDDAFIDLQDAWDVVTVPERWVPQRGPCCWEDNSCNSNWCEHCRERIGLNRRDNLVPHMRSKQLQLVTLTSLPNPRGRKAVQNLLKSLSNLTRLAVWKPVKGGFRNVHPGYHRDGWTFHIHAVVEANEMIDEGKLGRVWAGLTGASRVDVRAVRRSFKDHRNVVGYCLRPSLGTVPAGRLGEYSEAIKGRHLYRRFGSWLKFGSAR